MERRDQATIVAGRLARYVQTAGWSADSSVLADPLVIEAFCARGLAGRTSATRGTYRSVLRSWAGLADGGRARRGPGYPGARAPRPYTSGERAELISIASAQHPRHKRVSALVMVAAGLGAGLTTAELMALRGVDIGVGGANVVLVAVSGRRARQLPIAAPYGAILAEHAAAGEQPLFRPGATDRGYKNAVCNFAETLPTDPAGPRFTLGRARASFICDHIAAGTAVADVLAISGIAEAGSLTRYAVHVPGAPKSKGAWRARARTEAAATR